MQAANILVKITATLLLVSAVRAVSQGVGQIYFTHMYKPFYYENPKVYGVRVIYRPENAKRYSDDINFDVQIGFYAADSKASLENSYEEKVIDEHEDWDYMSWDEDGEFFYHDQFSGSVISGDWIGYGVAIYHGYNNLIYEDLDRYYVVPDRIDACVHDDIASWRQLKCSEALANHTAEVGKLSTNSNGKIGKPLFEVGPVSVSFSGPWIATGVVVPLVLIGIIVGIVYARRNGCATIRNARLFASFSKQPTQQVVNSQVVGHNGPLVTVNASIPQFHVQTSEANVALGFGAEPIAHVHMSASTAPVANVYTS